MINTRQILLFAFLYVYVQGSAQENNTRYIDISIVSPGNSESGLNLNAEIKATGIGGDLTITIISVIGQEDEIKKISYEYTYSGSKKFSQRIRRRIAKNILLSFDMEKRSRPLMADKKRIRHYLRYVKRLIISNKKLSSVGVNKTYMINP